ncbi:hypothetical protein Ahy_B02g059101 [Arachis hypogaea]|uniref:FAR1 domain-containing protein n=1 Tax=Arachis hypogaea TaxID=3818 RepID=A0A445AG42_ARAHY|nr:hypothetical protein Ahy_B02g059101 [Arachis hypogaea]
MGWWVVAVLGIRREKRIMAGTRVFCWPLSVVDDELVPKVGMTFTTLEDAGKFYRNYAKAAGFSTRVRCTNRKGNEIKNQLITCSREGK